MLFRSGVWGTITAYVSLITGFATLGLHIHLTNSYYEYKHRFKLIWRRLMFLMLLSSLLCTIITMVCLFFAIKSTAPYNKLIIIVLSSLPVLFNFNVVIANHYYGVRLLPTPLVIRNMTASICGALVLFITVYHFRLGYLGYVLSSLISALVLFFLFIKP